MWSGEANQFWSQLVTQLTQSAAELKADRSEEVAGPQESETSHQEAIAGHQEAGAGHQEAGAGLHEARTRPLEAGTGHQEAGTGRLEATGLYFLFSIMVGIFQKDLEIWWKHDRYSKPDGILPILHYVLGKSFKIKIR